MVEKRRDDVVADLPLGGGVSRRPLQYHADYVVELQDGLQSTGWVNKSSLVL